MVSVVMCVGTLPGSTVGVNMKHYCEDKASGVEWMKSKVCPIFTRDTGHTIMCMGDMCIAFFYVPFRDGKVFPKVGRFWPPPISRVESHVGCKLV